MIEPKVTVIATTAFRPLVFRDLTGWIPDENASMNGAEALTEASGRACFQSWHRPNPATASNEGYLRHILDVGHHSLLRHSSVSFYLEGISRSFSHQLVTHKHLNQSQLSQRFVSADDSFMVIPPAVLDGDAEALAMLEAVMNQARAVYARLVDRFTLQGHKPKQAREAARAVMPNMAETKMVVTGNLQAWRHFISVRATEHADAEMCRVAVMIAWELKTMYPNLFQDMHLRSRNPAEAGGGRDTVYFGAREDDLLVGGDAAGV